MMRDLRAAARRNWFIPVALLVLALHVVLTVAWLASAHWKNALTDFGFAAWVSLYLLTEITVSRKDRDINALASVLVLGGYGKNRGRS